MDICRNRKEEVERTKKAIERTPYLFTNETLETQPQPQPQPQHNHQSQQITNDWTRIERRRGRPTDLERAGADPK